MKPQVKTLTSLILSCLLCLSILSLSLPPFAAKQVKAQDAELYQIEWETPEPGLGQEVDAPVSGDIDDDGVVELLAATWEVVLYCFNGVTKEIEWEEVIPQIPGLTASMAIGDVDGDGQVEIVAGGNSWGEGDITVISHDGSETEWNMHFVDAPILSVALLDINGNGRKEIIACSQGTFWDEALMSDVVKGKVYAIDGASPHDILWQTLWTEDMGPYLDVADVDNDGTVEVVTSGMFVLNSTNGAEEWSDPTPVAPLALGDIDDDGKIEIVSSIIHEYDGVLDEYVVDGDIPFNIKAIAIGNTDDEPKKRWSASGRDCCLAMRKNWWFWTDQLYKRNGATPPSIPVSPLCILLIPV